MKLKKKNFVVLYCEDWNTPLKTSKHHFIERLAFENNKILYIEVPLNPFNFFLNSKNLFKKNLFKGVVKVKKNIWTLKPIVPLPYHPFLGKITDNLTVNYINQKIMTFYLKYAFKKLNFFDIEAIIYLPMIYPMLQRLNFKKVHFHIVDEWQGFSGIPDTMKILTKNLIEKANNTIVTSETLFNKYKKFTSNIFLLNHGTDPDLFKKGINFKKLKQNKSLKFKIGYYGSLEKLNFELINSVSKNLIDCKFYFVGPITNPVRNEIEKIESKNVNFISKIKRTKLTFFLKKLDVFWLTFKVNELTKSMSPIKIYEVLSAGIPIVSESLQECKNIAKEHILFCSNVEQHIKNLKFAIKTDSIEKIKLRINFVKPYSWDNRYNNFKKFLKLDEEE